MVHPTRWRLMEEFAKPSTRAVLDTSEYRAIIIIVVYG